MRYSFTSYTKIGPTIYWAVIDSAYSQGDPDFIVADNIKDGRIAGDISVMMNAGGTEIDVELGDIFPAFNHGKTK
jgi:hypothetical protein